MKTKEIRNVIQFVFLILLVSFVTNSCKEKDIDIPIDENQNIIAEVAYHDKIRENPFPNKKNRLYINPSPLIVPTEMKKDYYLQFELSRNTDFNESETIRSGNVIWNMFNPHQILAEGEWFWRFRSVSKNGQEGSWSEIHQFNVDNDTDIFVTPKFSEFINNIPKDYPRLYCFFNNEIEAARKNVTFHPEYKRLIGRANSALAASFNSSELYNKIADIKAFTIFLYQAYFLTLDSKYLDKMLEFHRAYLNNPFTDNQLFFTNFTSTDYALALVKTYDLANDILTAAEKQQTKELLMKIARYYFQMYCGKQENHIFDNHFWQHNMRILFQIAFVLHTESEYAVETKEMMEYYYELWTARAPDSGFNREGLWRNGTYYFSVNVKTLAYFPSLFSYVTKSDFLQHPWYKNIGKSLVYSWPPNSKSIGTGDGSELNNEPDRQRVAFADFIANKIHDNYAAWYADQCKATLVDDYEFRLYRMTRNKVYENTSLSNNTPKLVWFRDAGEVYVHSDLVNLNNNLALSFRSSTFGSGSHTLANQNSFNLIYKGLDVYRSSGYYIDFAGPHNLMSYRHTRAHNTILVNGIGQPYSMKGYGNITRAINGERISYCLGDASNAYTGISDDPMWIDNFRKAGIAQSVANGFGETPLKLYKRHVIMLHPSIIVLYDELSASEAVRWDWLLHSPHEFKISQEQKSTEITFGVDKKLKSTMQLFSDGNLNLTQTNQFLVPPTTTPDSKYPNQWHLTAAFSPSQNNRILSIIQVVDNSEKLLEIAKNGNSIKLGNWEISVELNPSQKPMLSISNDSDDVYLNYGAKNPKSGNVTYTKFNENSTLLYDVIDGEKKSVEISDYIPISTRIQKQ